MVSGDVKPESVNVYIDDAIRFPKLYFNSKLILHSKEIWLINLEKSYFAIGPQLLLHSLI